ncbi:hypothetical protein PVAP13_7KG046736 [Panicum virgatum]|uniref:Uncharacterized protein n=1 Tax=Panicum virgatum TaxID=38727 RepID=A0A8T0QB05_PANVG|nr:hypothetical protein PVAP13_7KG046736 [Panicum virgatum]
MCAPLPGGERKELKGRAPWSELEGLCHGQSSRPERHGQSSRAAAMAGARGRLARRRGSAAQRLVRRAWGWVAAGSEGGSGGDGRRRVVATEVGVAGKSRDEAGGAAGREAGQERERRG